MKWHHEREPSGVLVHRSGPYRAWHDCDVEYGPYAASVTVRGEETILGHRPRMREAKALARQHEREDG